jgi:enamine deaminase RidA (YjgF/YER057c/UK114 family)
MRNPYLTSLRWSAALTALAAILLGTTARGEGARLSIGGYDPVAYFTDGKPIPGKSEFEYVWHDARWRFASAAHRNLFVNDPEHYAPQYDGYCAMGIAGIAVATPHKDTVDPEAWAIVDGKLYLTHTMRTMEERWWPNAAENIKRADENWSTVERQSEPLIVGPPCADHPPSVIVSLQGGGRRVIVGGQVAVGEDDNIVGKGNMREQVEQVGKNVQACLKAAGANVSDIMLTRVYVTDSDAFAKNTDVFARYLGPQPPGSIVNRTSLAAGVDFLVEIEAIAALNSPAPATADGKP